MEFACLKAVIAQTNEIRPNATIQSKTVTFLYFVEYYVGAAGHPAIPIFPPQPGID